MASTVHRSDLSVFRCNALQEVAECSQIAVDVLKQGGNAADGVIAAALCVGTIAACTCAASYPDPSSHVS